MTLAGRHVLQRCLAVAGRGSSGRAGRAERRRQDHAAAGAVGAAAVRGDDPYRRRCAGRSVAARARKALCLSAAGPHRALAAAGARYRGARPLSAWRDRSGAAVAEGYRSRTAGDAGGRCGGIQRTPRHRTVRRRAQPRRAGARARGGSAGHPRRRADRLARSAPPDRRDEEFARHRRQGRAGHRGDARPRPRRAICRSCAGADARAGWCRRARRRRRCRSR